MFSKPYRPFSQGGNLSQLAPFSGTESHSNIIQASEVSQQEIRDETPCSSANAINDTQPNRVYNKQASEASQQEIPDETLYSRANSICEENRQIRSFVESNLKQLERQRLKLINKRNNLNKEIETHLKIQENQGQQCLELQMNLEEWTEKYQGELNQRPKLIDQLQNTDVLVEMFSKFYSHGSAALEDMEKVNHSLGPELETLDTEATTIKMRETEMTQSFTAKMENTIRECREHRESIMKEREKSLDEIKALVKQRDEKSSKISTLQAELKSYSNKKEELNDKFNGLTLDNKSVAEEISRVQMQLDELKTVSALHIQDIKIKINTERNNNFHLAIKLEEKEDCLNSLFTKEKELTNLSSQLKVAVAETTKRNEDQFEKIKNCEDANNILKGHIKSLEESIKQLENVENENRHYTSNISELEESIHLKAVILNEKESLVKDLSNQTKSSQQTLSVHNEKLSEIKEELQNCICIQNQLALKVEEDKLKYLQEREVKMAENKNLEKMNSELNSNLNEMSLKVKETQDLNNSFKTSEEDIKNLIKDYNINAKKSEEKLKFLKKEWEDSCCTLNKDINEKHKEIHNYEVLLLESKPKQDMIPALLTKKAVLEKYKCDLDQTFKKDVDIMESSFNSKILMMDKEREKYTSIMQNLIKAEHEATEKIKEDIKETEKTKMKHEVDLRVSYQELNKLKSDEVNKRNKIVKMEKRLRTINREVKVTREDISNSIVGRISAPKKSHTSTNLMTPTSSVDSWDRFKEPPTKKLALSKDLSFTKYTKIEDNTKKWVESVPEDEYDFTEI